MERRNKKTPGKGYKERMTKMQIISRLWSHVTDLGLLIVGNESKTLEDIEKEIDVTEILCRPYADADDEEMLEK